MSKVCLVLALVALILTPPLRAFNWETATSNGRDYVTLQSFCAFYGFTYQNPNGNNVFDTRSTQHSLRFKLGSPDMYLDGVHYVMSFPVEGGDHDWLVSRMDVIKLFEPVIRPTEISDRHTIRGVVIDAGHGGSDNGAVSAHGGMEKTYTRDTAFRLEDILRQAGLKTVLTRRSDVFVDLYERAHIASLYPDYCFVSIHYNSATPEAHGLETYCLSPRGAASTSSNYLSRSDIQKLPGNDYDASNILLASMVHSEIIHLNAGDGSADRGVKRARFVVIKQNVLPAILVEGGFVSNRMEAARINTDAYRQSLAQAIARGVIRFVNVMGDRHLSLPGGDSNTRATVPSPVPALVAPSGMASDVKPPAKPDSSKSSTSKSATTPGAGTSSANSGSSTGNSTASSATSTHKSKKKKKGLASSATTPASITNASSATPPTESSPSNTSSKKREDYSTPAPGDQPSPTPAPPAPADQSASTNSAPKKPYVPLDLSEPPTPAPSAVSEKAAPEPDEPPTVNIYSTTPSANKSATNAPSSSKPEPENP